MVNINKILKQEIELVGLDNSEIFRIKKISKDFCDELKKKLDLKGLDAEVFIGGSLAKKTLVKKKVQDVDIFVRFSNKYDSNKISSLLGNNLGKNVKKIHGSRDYFQIVKEGIVLEIIPVMKIKTSLEADNITDLSYFHVNYILKKLKIDSKIADEIILAKTFAHSCDCYGAESYINGFSGYALELLICHYGSFIKFVKAVVKSKINEQVFIDDAGFYKNKKEILISLNESKLMSPIILIDPTFKDRNALAGLSSETFFKFKKYCFNFLKNPSHEFFKTHEISEEFKKYNNVKVVEVRTNKQAGDIAGTKLKKFFRFFCSKLERDFEIRKKGFSYDDEKNVARFYFVLNKKKDEEIKGPPITSLENLKNFKKVHPDAFIKKGFAYIKIKHLLEFDEWFKKFVEKEKRIIKGMSINGLDLVEF